MAILPVVVKNATLARSEPQRAIGTLAHCHNIVIIVTRGMHVFQLAVCNIQAIVAVAGIDNVAHSFEQVDAVNVSHVFRVSEEDTP